MKEDLHNIDKLFKSSIDEHEEMPSPDVWNAIDKNLDQNSIIDITTRYLTLKKVAVILLVLLASISFYEITTWKTEGKLVKNSKPFQNKTNVLPGDKSQNNPVNKKPAALQEAAKPPRALNTEQAYTQMRNTGENRVNLGPDSVRTNYGKLSATRKNSPVLKSVEHIATPASGTNATDKPIVTAADADMAFRYLSEDRLNKYDELGNVSKANKNNVLADGRLSTAFTGHTEMSAPGLIDLYESFPSPSFNKISCQPILGKISTEAIKLTVSKRSRFAATVFFSRDFVSNRLAMDGFGNHERERDRDEIKRTENASSSYTTGVLAEYAINNNWSIQSGLTISKTTIDIEPKTIYAKPDDFGNVKFRFNCSAGYSFLSLKTGMPPSNGDSLHALESSNTTQYVGIPITVKYNISPGKFRFSAMAGISVNILSNQKIKTVIANGGNNEKSVINEINGLRPSYFSGLLGLGLDYSLTKNVALSLIPNARIALTSINKDAPVRSYPQSFGLGAGIRFQL